MTAEFLFYPIVVPALAGILLLFLPRKAGVFHNILLVGTAVLSLWFAYHVYGKNLVYDHAWGGFAFRFTLRLYHFSSFIIFSTAAFAVLISLYCSSFMKGKPNSGLFYAFFLLTLSATSGAVLADDLIVLLFFWEFLLITLYGMIYVGHPGAFRTATKAFIIIGISDLCMMTGMAFTSHLAHTTQISQIHLQTGGMASFAFILLIIGATAKAGAMPFHSWIPDAANDAPLPFMALVPAAFEKLLGIYFLARICLDMFSLKPDSSLSLLLMIMGACTILFAVLMALIQKDFKRLLSFHAISQVGYMVLGIGTAVPAGILGGLFHMINHALYKSCLFLSGGAVEKQTGTTDLARLGGVGRFMPLTFLGFTIAALSISGVPPFNGFFSKELVYEGAMQRHWAFYAAALMGSFLTAASFLKLGHAAFLGKPRSDLGQVKEAPLAMLVPILVIAGMCVFFGVYNSWPIEHLIAPIAGINGAHFSGFPKEVMLTAGTLLVLALALLNHFHGVKRSGSALGAADHIHHAPVLGAVYARAEKRAFDPYEIGMHLAHVVAAFSFGVDRAIDWVFNRVFPMTAMTYTRVLRVFHSGSPARYLMWCMAGFAVVLLTLIYG